MSCGSRWIDRDCRLVLTGSVDATARLWDVETGEQRLVLHGHTAKLVSVDFSPTAISC
jgi:WD40 repeat protein